MPRKRSKWAIIGYNKLRTQRKRPRTLAWVDRGRSAIFVQHSQSSDLLQKALVLTLSARGQVAQAYPQQPPVLFTGLSTTTQVLFTGTRTESGRGEPSVHQARHVCRGQNDTRSKADPPYPLGPPCLNVHGYRTQLSQVHTPNPLSPPNIALMCYMVNHADNEAVRIHLQLQHAVCVRHDVTVQIWISISVGTDKRSSAG